jgi:Flp pilus assembly protein TadG
MHLIHKLRRDERGMAAIEFAMSLGAVVTLGVYGTEMSNLALAHLKVSQVAIGLADNMSRVGLKSSLAQQQLRESDINDALVGAQVQGQNWGLGTQGRITVSSIQLNAQNGQWIKWQRCLGMMAGAGWDSSYGGEDTGSVGTSYAGMGPPGSEVTAPPGSQVIFVEINYDYKPVVNFGLNTARKLTYLASMVVRANRDPTQVYNPNPTSTKMSCDKHTATVPKRG